MQAEPIIRKSIPNLKIVIAGKGEELSIYDEFIVNKDSYIIKNYAIPLAEVSDLFDEASLVVLPYIEATQSGVIPVAYPFCKPVVASSVGALPEVVIDGKTGFLVPPADPQALADKIIFLLQNPDIRHEMGLSAKRYSDEKLDWKEIAKTTLEIYSSLK
jgi:glycosyltransferase involved in cell wall biosynthesis